MNNTPNTTTATNQLNQTKRVGGFANKRHDLATRNRISQTQKARYAYMRQMMKQQQESKQAFGPIDSPQLSKMIKDILRELLNEEIRKATPIMQNIPLY